MKLGGKKLLALPNSSQMPFELLDFAINLSWKEIGSTEYI